MDSSWSLKQCTREEQTQRDMLSCLPDQLLIQILSLLPTKCALVVCVLLNKMMLLPWITNLDFDASPISHCLKRPNRIQRLPLFQTFVESVLQAHQSPFLTRFRLNLAVQRSCVGAPHYFAFGHNVACLPPLNSSQLHAWITFPLSRSCLKELDLRVHVRGPCNQSPFPPQVFINETLEVLKLDVNLSFDGISTFRLPNLKTLYLHASIISEDAFLTSLVSSCPLLEELDVKAWWNHVHFTNISSPSLRRLSLCMLKLPGNVNGDGDDNTDLVVLDTPNLEDLLYIDNLALHYSITSMPRLVKATVHFKYPFQWESLEVNCQRLLIFIRALSNVRHLSLAGVCSQVLDCIEEYERLPIFHDLILLKLSMISRVERNTLLGFLYRSPQLKTLVFKGGILDSLSQDDEKSRLEYEQESRKLILATVPWCCKYNLKRFLVYSYSGSVEEILYIQFLFKYSLVLEELVVITKDPTKDVSLLQNLPRASATCSIQLHVHHGFGPFPQLY